MKQLLVKLYDTEREARRGFVNWFLAAMHNGLHTPHFFCSAKMSEFVSGGT